MKKRMLLLMRGLSIRLFWNGIGEAHADPEWPEWFKKNTTDVYFIHLELQMAFICQISVGKWKYVNPCLDFLGIPDQRTAYVKRQVRPGWTYVRRSSVTPDLRKIPRRPGPPLILGECPPSRGPTTTTSKKHQGVQIIVPCKSSKRLDWQ